MVYWLGLTNIGISGHWPWLAKSARRTLHSGAGVLLQVASNVAGSTGTAICHTKPSRPPIAGLDARRNNITSTIRIMETRVSQLQKLTYHRRHNPCSESSGSHGACLNLLDASHRLARFRVTTRACQQLADAGTLASATMQTPGEIGFIAYHHNIHTSTGAT